MFHSKFFSKAGGAAIIISKNVLFEPVRYVIEDVNGLYVIVSSLIRQVHF